MKNILKNKNILVIGATGSIGYEICKELKNYECNIIASGTKTSKLKKLKKIFNNCTSKLDILKCNLNNERDVNNMILKIRNRYNINAIINCAGIFVNESIEKVSTNKLNEAFNINIKSPFRIIKESIKHMKRKKWGRVVNIGSSSSYQGFNNSSVYCATKHAMLGFTKALHQELKKYNIRCYCVSPSSTKGAMGLVTKNQDYETFLNPEDVAKYIIFIISFDSNIMSEELFLNRMIIK
jgi:short-subunit dehydrogenase